MFSTAQIEVDFKFKLKSLTTFELELMDKFDFDSWAKLARAAPDDFEQRRRAVIESQISSSDNVRRLRGLQCLINMERMRARTPLKCCLRALTFENLAIENLTEPFNFEIFFGDRVAILGKNGTGKSHFLRMISGDQSVKYTGEWKLGARVDVGYFAQTHAHPEFESKTLLEILWQEHSLQLGPAKSVLRKYEIDGQAEQKFSSLSGGQQARFQVLLLELMGSTALLLDEPTDNLDLASAESLEAALNRYEGTVLAVTHDRWFTRGFTRFLIFGANGRVYESPEPIFDH